MGKDTLRTPDLKKLDEDNKYLVSFGGLEITPCVWIHPVHNEICCVFPNGSLHLFTDRLQAIWDCNLAWKDYTRPTVYHNSPRWPSLSERSPEILQLPGA